MNRFDGMIMSNEHIYIYTPSYKLYVNNFSSMLTITNMVPERKLELICDTLQVAALCTAGYHANVSLICIIINL
jgi:hypothetical protein